MGSLGELSWGVRHADMLQNFLLCRVKSDLDDTWYNCYEGNVIQRILNICISYAN